MSISAHMKRLWQNRSGVVALEFGLVLPLYLGGLLFAIEAGRIAYTQSAISYAAHQASRYVMTRPNAEESLVQSQVINNLIGIDPERVSVSVATLTSGSLDEVAIDVSYQFEFLGFPAHLGGLNLSSTSTTPSGGVVNLGDADDA